MLNEHERKILLLLRNMAQHDKLEISKISDVQYAIWKREKINLDKKFLDIE